MALRDLFRVENPADWQVEGLRALDTEPRLAIRSGHGVGKTAWLAWVALIWMITRSGPRVACTAPSGHQLEDTLWPEIGIWHGRLPDPLRVQLNVTSEKVTMVGHPEHYIVARTSRPEKPEAFQGFHSEHMLFLSDEASGVPDIIYEVARGAMSSPNATEVNTGNPTRNVGKFYRAFHKHRSKYWTRKVSQLEVAHLPWASSTYAQEMADEYGINSNAYRIRVLGEFAKAGNDQLIDLDIVEAATTRNVDPIGYRPIWGVDVAEKRDRNCLCKRAGNVITEPISWWPGRDTMQTTGEIVRQYRIAEEEEAAGMGIVVPQWIRIDSIGIGAGVVARCREQGLPAVGVNVGSKALNPSQFFNLRDELTWIAKQWFEAEDVRMPEDDGLIEEATAVGYDLLSNGKVKVWPKEKIKDSLQGRSPDKWDALCLTFGVHQSVIQQKSERDRYVAKPARRSWISY